MLEPLFLFIIAALVFSAFIKGALGLGFSTICLAIVANVIDLKMAISIVLLPSLISNAMVMINAGQFRASWQQFWLMLIMTIPGMLLGLQLLKQANNAASIIILAVVLMTYGVWGLIKQTFTIRDALIKPLNPVIGLVTGMLNGATGSQIFPVMPYLLSLNISKAVMVQTVNMSFTLCSVIMLIALAKINALDIKSITTYSLGIIPVAIGVWLGNKIHQRLSDTHFKQAVMVLIILLGALLFIRHF